MDAFRFQDAAGAADGVTHFITLCTIDALTERSSASDEVLNQGGGECELQWQDLREIVADVLLAQDGEEYRIGDFVVMPNHLHVLVGLYPGRSVAEQAQAWMKRSTELINDFRRRTGNFWHDLVISSPVADWDDFDECRKRIRRDPKSAGLRVGEYYLHIAEVD